MHQVKYANFPIFLGLLIILPTFDIFFSPTYLIDFLILCSALSLVSNVLVTCVYEMH